MGNTAATAASTGQVAATAAEVYDSFFLPALFERWASPMVEAARISPGDHVLDVGCGTGVLARRAAAVAGPSGRIVGVDPNAGMLAVARRTSGIEWTNGTAEDLPADAATFDAVVSQFALMFFRDRGRAIAEMSRVLRPGGRLAIATWASLDEAPGYSAMVGLLDRLFGRDAADALRAPYCLGDPDELAALVGQQFDDVAVEQRQGVARFDSIEAWVHTDVRGWTLSDLSDADERRLLDAAQSDLAEFTLPDGTVEFAHPALIATATATATAARNC